MSDDTLVRFTAHELRRDDLRALMVRSNGPAMARALSHFGLLVVTGTLVWMGRATLWVIPLLIAHGYVLAFLFCAFHESAHRTAFRSRWLNVLVGSVAGFLTFWPYRNYRVFHWEHHRYTQDAARDPELFFPKPASVGAYLFVLTGIPNCVRRVGDILILEARIYLALYLVLALLSVLARSPMLLLVWILPWLVGQAFLRPYLLAEHTACAFTTDCLDNTRTTLTVPLVRLFAWNMPYHAEHHAYPAVPFHALPRLHERVQARIANLDPGYLAATAKVNRYLFGDPDAHRLAGLR